jgi:hypothetical protein
VLERLVDDPAAGATTGGWRRQGLRRRLLRRLLRHWPCSAGGQAPGCVIRARALELEDLALELVERAATWSPRRQA